MIENRNLILAIVISVLILVAFQFLSNFHHPKEPVTTPVASEQTTTTTTPGAASAPTGTGTTATGATPPSAFPAPETPAPSVTPGEDPELVRARVLAQTPRVHISAPRVHGSISLIGARVDDVTLAKYHETLSDTSPEIILFSPPGVEDAYFAQFGWVAKSGEIELPGADTLWQADRDTLTPEHPVTLSWTNPAGITFKRVFAIDDDYMFTITDYVINGSESEIGLSPYSLISRHGTPKTGGYFILHEGPLGVFNDTLVEVDYKELLKDGTINEKSKGGWIGITDKYWLSAIIPDRKDDITARFFHERFQNTDRYQVDFLEKPIVVPAKGEISSVRRLFAGAKEVRLLDRYEEEYGISRFDRAIDFGWFYFLTKPMFYFLIYIKELVGNLGIAILLLTVSIKLLFFPLANKSYRAMSKMRKLQPEIMKMKERFGDDKARFNQEMMALYKREKVNPASGCLPIIIQIPVFFSLYKVLFVTIEMRHAPFFGWIHDLSAPDPTSVWNLFGLIPWDPATIIPATLNIGAWPLIMGVTMFLQQRLNPQPPDPMQAKLFMLMPIMFTFFLAHFPSGLVVYWAWNNFLSIVQQWVIMRRMGVKP